MRQSVRDAFYDFNTPLEGVVPWMYLDIMGYVTVGVGNLLPNEAAAAALPFYQNNDETDLADDATKRQAFNDVKARQDLRQRGHRAYESLTNLRLSDQSTRQLVDDKLMSNWAYVYRSFPQLDDWPADAQLGLMSMAWALGPAFPPQWPKFATACRAQDFELAAAECTMREAGNPGVVPRNAANRTLFTNASRVLSLGASYGYDPNVLYYPTVILAEIVIEG